MAAAFDRSAALTWVQLKQNVQLKPCSGLFTAAHVCVAGLGNV